MNKKLLDYLVNGTRKSCWCPGCERENQPTAVCGVWLSTTGRLVCSYGVCADCVSSVPTPAFADMVEHRLLTRYPQLRLRLPENYQSSASQN